MSRMRPMISLGRSLQQSSESRTMGTIPFVCSGIGLLMATLVLKLAIFCRCLAVIFKILTLADGSGGAAWHFERVDKARQAQGCFGDDMNRFMGFAIFRALASWRS